MWFLGFQCSCSWFAFIVAALGWFWFAALLLRAVCLWYVFGSSSPVWSRRRKPPGL